MPAQTIPRSRKIKSKKLIGELFKKSSSAFVYPVKALYLSKSETVHDLPQIMLIVSKRNFPKAVHRNRIKRLITEAYRQLQSEYKEVLNTENQTPSHIAFIYVAKKEESLNFIKSQLKVLLDRIYS